MGTDPRDASDIQEIFAGSFGANVPIPVEDVLGVRVSVGLALQLTKDVLLQQEVPFPTEAQLVLVESRPRRLHLLPTLGVDGRGVTEGSLSAAQIARLSLQAGALLRPADGWRVGVAFRGEMTIELNTPVVVRFEDLAVDDLSPGITLSMAF